MTSPSFLAFDLGAGSGRAILGTLDEGRLTLKELHRFPNNMAHILGHWHWNVFLLYEEIKEGLKKCAAGAAAPESLAFDTWGVDFGLVGEDGTLLGLPHAYRDSRTDGAMEAFFEIVPRERVYELTGIQFMQFNTLFQLFATKRDNGSMLSAATDLLFMPDIFNYLFTGRKTTEFTFATTSQLFNPATRAWENELFSALGVSPSMMQDIIQPGTELSPVNESICRETGMGALPVVACASHDTGSAVAAVPAEGNDWAYISSGTWSLMGIESKTPLNTPKALGLNFTNEGGVEGFRFLKNITGLWLLQACLQSWKKKKSYTYEELLVAAEKEKPFQSFVDPDRPEFLNPPDMAEAIAGICRETGQNVPGSPAAFTRAILESLAMKYRGTLDQLKTIRSDPINRIHVMGGGSQNAVLNQYTANATGLPVVAGPVEATAIGNIMVQALAMGHVKSLAQMREVIRTSFTPVIYEPERTGEWEEAYARFKEIVQ